MKRMVFASAIAAATMATAAEYKTPAEEIKALKETIASNSVTRETKKNRYYMAWYRELCTEAERKAILERNVAAHRRWIELSGKKSAYPRAELGKVLGIGGRCAEAVPELEAAIASGDLGGRDLADARWALAECLWNLGEIDAAKRVVAELAAMKWPGEPPFAALKAGFMHRAWTDPDGDIDALALPHSVDGKPYPTPQDAKYEANRVSLARVAIKVEGKSVDDPIVRLLKRKLARFGVEIEEGKSAEGADCATVVTLRLSPDAPVDKPQGYEIKVGRKKGKGKSIAENVGEVAISARDRLGLVWGVVSFLQCVDRGECAQEGNGVQKPMPGAKSPSIRELAIRDWPKLERRGVIEARWWPEFLEYALFNKMSSLVIKIGRPEFPFEFSGLERERAKITIRRFGDFGIEPYWSEREISVDPVLPLTAERTRDLHLRWFKCAASFGGNVCFEMDDERFFDFPEQDKKAAGSATNLDSKYMTGLYREIKKDYPGFKLIFGTPFYFGPDGAARGDWYPEPRDAYLESHKAFLDPEIDVYWSGPRVKSIGFTPEKIQWMTDKIGRKPVVYHNSDCVWRHGHDIWGVDVPGFKKSHCPETLDMIGAFYMNTTFMRENSRTSPAMDWCWNPDAHDAETATRRSVDMLEGPGVYEILAAVMPEVSYFDKYLYGQARGELMTEDPDDLDRRAALAADAWDRARAVAKNGGLFVDGFGLLAVNYSRRLANYRRNPPKWLLDQFAAEKANTSFAEKETGFDAAKGDIFLPAAMLNGGFWHTGIKDKTDRPACGAKELKAGEILSGKFTLEPFPPEGSPKMIVVGQAYVEAWDKGFAVELPETEVSVNGKKIWSGKMFADGEFKPCEIPLPVASLLRTSTFEVRWTGPEIEHQRRPMVHYVVIRK